MRITNLQNYSFTNPGFGYNLPKHLPNRYVNGNRMQGKTEDICKRIANLALQNGDAEEYNRLLEAIKNFRNARFDATKLIATYLPFMQKFKLEDKFNKFLNKFNAPVNEKGEKDFSKINASLGDISCWETDHIIKLMKDLFEFNGSTNKWELKEKRDRGLDFTINCGHKISGITACYDEEEFELLMFEYARDIENLQNRVNTKITEYFDEKCQYIISQANDSDIKELVDKDFKELFNDTSKNQDGQRLS